ncbi:MAG: hypothetical protein KDD40_08960, partial [Bdellovibrionales bacterium]|nr:hypothetical protein [Bdellovibrionales bacterium]
MKYEILHFFLIAIISFFGRNVFAIEAMDINSMTQVIEKLEKAIPIINDNSLKNEALIGRIADLYAERSRKKFLLEIERNCKNCLQSREDRLAAIKYYQKLLKNSKNSKTKHLALFQVAHLMQLTGQDVRAEKLFKKVISKANNKDSVIMAEAQAGLVEIYYARGNYRYSLFYANKALSSKYLNKPGLVTYRKAWSQLNLGYNVEARNTLIHLLKSPQLLTLQTSEGSQLDVSFQEDVARDLALFLARGNVTQKEVELLMELSPASKIYDNLFFLGQELSRVAAYKSALMVWDLLLESNKLNSIQQLEIKIRKSELQLTANKKRSALASYREAVKHWQQYGCADPVDCEALKIRLKNIVINWHKQDGKKVTKILLAIYQEYVSLFSIDSDMCLKAAQVAKSLKMFSEAKSLYRLASLNAKDKDSKGPAFEAALIGEIEAAEATNNMDSKQDAYEYYLKVNDKGEKAIEVQYQMAHLLNYRKKHQAAADLFYFISQQKGKKYRGLKIKAADLAIDSLVLAGNHKKIETLAPLLAQKYKNKKVEFLGHARKASLNIVKNTMETNNVNKDELTENLQRLKNIPLLGAKQKEKIQIAKAKIKISEKLNDLEQLSQAAKELYSIKNLTIADNDLALSYLAWTSELKLDFKNAYKYTKK